MKNKVLTNWVFLLFFTSLVAYFGCATDNPTSSNPDPETDNKVVENVATSTVDINKNVSAFKQISELIHGPDNIVDLEIPELGDFNSSATFARSISQTVLSRVSFNPKQQTVQGDSVLWDFTERDENRGVTQHVKLIYCTDTGEARLFVVNFDYLENHPLEYDSTEIKADLNFTIYDDSDDVLLSLHHLKRFKPGQLIHEEKGSFVPDDHAPGTEPTGGVLTNEITYSSSSFISSTNATFEYHEASGGSFVKVTEFSDGTSHTEEATFTSDGTGTFKEMRRDGTLIEGTFDSAEEDGVGGYSKTVTFPSGHDPVSISESGEFTFTFSDSTIDGSFERVVTREDGSEERENVSVNQTRVGEVLTTTLNIEKSDGSSGYITITESPDVDQVAGEWINTDETFVKFTAEEYSDGSAHLVVQVWQDQAAFENGIDPIATGEFDFYPDGSGRGTVTQDGKTYEVIIHPDGSVTIRDIS